MNIGGITEEFLGGSSVNFIIGMLSFCSGIGIGIQKMGKLIKLHGVLMLVKVILSVVISLLFIVVFGQSGVFGISALALAVTLTSMNPALYISLVKNYGDEVDESTFDLTGLFGIPALPMVVYALSGQGEIDGIPAMSMNAVAASSASFPAVIAQANPSLEPFVIIATAQILTVAIIALFVTPVIVRKLYGKNMNQCQINCWKRLFNRK